MTVIIYIITFWCVAESWSSRVASWVWVAPPQLSLAASPEIKPENTDPKAVGAAGNPVLPEEPRQH